MGLRRFLRRYFKEYSKGTRVILGLRRERTREYARLHRTSVKIQSTNELLYNRWTRHQGMSENIGEGGLIGTTYLAQENQAVEVRSEVIREQMC